LTPRGSDRSTRTLSEIQRRLVTAFAQFFFAAWKSFLVCYGCEWSYDGNEFAFCSAAQFRFSQSLDQN